MLTALMIVLAVLLVLGMAALVSAAFRGCVFATVYCCCGGLTCAAEFLGTLLVAIAAGLTGKE